MLRRKPARAKTAGRTDGAGASDGQPAATRHHHRHSATGSSGSPSSPGDYVAIQTSTVDAAGDSVTETIQHADQITSCSANGAAR